MKNTAANIKQTLSVSGKDYQYYSIKAAEQTGLGNFALLPFSLKVLLENLLRFQDNVTVTMDDVKALGVVEHLAEHRQVKAGPPGNESRHP